MLSYDAARQKVIEVAKARRGRLSTERIELSQALGRVLAETIAADRDYPPFHRSTRDGYAVRAADLSAARPALRLIGESKAGAAFSGVVGACECVQIMTGAPVPTGADAVVMLEHVRATGGQILVERPVRAGENIVAAGSEARAGQKVLECGRRLGYAELASAAQVGRTRLMVYCRPRVAILSTGDEVVAVDRQPGPFEIRNSNSVSLAAQVALAGGEPVPLGNAPDRIEALRAQIECGLEEDILVMSGGVSAGKYDLVEEVLRDLGAEFHFDAIAIRPGRPAVFAECHSKLAFGLPGNPVSTMVTFELLVTPAIEVRSGLEPQPLPLFKARLAKAVALKAALTHFLPAVVSWASGEPVVDVLPWQGSGDVVALAGANCFLVVHEEKLSLAEGEWVDVLLRRGAF
jgi:molybdopterin molybdotransferase